MFRFFRKLGNSVVNLPKNLRTLRFKYSKQEYKPFALGPWYGVVITLYFAPGDERYLFHFNSFTVTLYWGQTMRNFSIVDTN